MTDNAETASTAGELDFPAIYQRAIENMFELYVTPEVARRQSAGTLPSPIEILAAQVMFLPSSVEVRINSEVRGHMRVRTPGGVPLEIGQTITNMDIEAIEAFELLPHDQDLGHFTLVRVGPFFHLSFDFRKNRAYAMRLLSKAAEFLQAAELALDAELWSPFGDSLFSAAELTAKAELVVNVLAADTKSHAVIHRTINQWGHLGNVPSEFVRLFNRLSDSRSLARYKPETTGEPPTASQDLAIVRSEIDRLKRAIGPRLDVDTDDQ